MRASLDRVIDWLHKDDTILIIIHQFPDGDTIASSLALARALKTLGKTVVVTGKDPVPAPFMFLPESDTIQRDYLGGDWQVIIVLDCGDLKRTGFVERIRSFARDKKRLINIDHHPKNDLHKIANITYFDGSAAAVGEIVTEIIDLLGVRIDKEMATCLLTALYTDTGGFKHSNTTVTTLEYAARFMEAGARLKKISNNISNSKSVASLHIWGIILSRIMYTKKIGLVRSIVTQRDLQECGATLEDLGGAVNLIGAVPGARASMLFVELPDGQIKASLRTESDSVDVSKIAEIFGGGGHKKASGFIINGTIFQEKGKWSIIQSSLGGGMADTRDLKSLA